MTSSPQLDNGNRPAGAPAQTSKRLLEAWQGEVEAGIVYALLADREKEPKRTDVLRRMAAGEAKHRERLEQRACPVVRLDRVAQIRWASLWSNSR
jgi:rubrerythrin